jgi:HK97 family phage prohead protease
MEHKAFNIELKFDEQTGSVEGYASTFGNEDSYSDIVVPGAFKNSISGRMPKMLWQHFPNQPIGVWEAVKEDSKGLYVRGRFADTQLGRDARELAKIGAIDSMSIGFATKRERYDQEKRVRYLEEVELWEVSLVTFPANDQARIVNVKRAQNITNIRELEQFLRDVGLSCRQAKAVAAHGFAGLNLSEDDLRDAGAEVVEKLNKLELFLKGM